MIAEVDYGPAELFELLGAFVIFGLQAIAYMIGVAP